MIILAQVLAGLVALLHLYFLVLEMFLWTTPKGIKTFGLPSKKHAESTKVLAANQGLYNGFLAAGILVGLIGNFEILLIFSLCCVTIAGIYGSYSTGKPRIFIIQSVPAILALIAFYLS